ncbi:MAG TPA: ABC transporter permease subunit [Methylomirabilota bacterium]|nr:ABC transporter permease subunit [Methylomirabilota bacterium]
MNWTLLANSLLVAGASTGIALALGLAVAVAMTAAPPALRRVLLVLTVAVLALPSFLATNCWIDLLGVNGLLHRWLPLNIFSTAGAVWILALLFWPVPALAIWSAWQKLEPVHFEIDPQLRGASLFRYLLLPTAKSHLVVSGAVVFALALNNFAVPTILQVKVFTSEIWLQFNANLDALAAAQLSWLVILPPVLLLLFFRGVEFSWPRETAGGIAQVFRRQLGHPTLAGATAVCCAILILSLLAPLAQLLGTPRTWAEFLPALAAGRSAVLHSLLYAVSATGLALVLAIALARVRALGWLWILFFIPGVLLGIAAVSAFNHPVFDLFSRTAAIVIAVLLVRYFALARSITRTAIGSLDEHLLDSARLDGARGMGLFRRIILPQIAPQLAAAAYIVYVLCLWDVETILLVIPPGGETLALRIFNLLHYGHNAHVNALCLLLLLLALAPLVLFPIWKALRRT